MNEKDLTKITKHKQIFPNTELLSCYWRVTENNDLAQVWRKAICDAPYFLGVSTYEPTGEKADSKRWRDDTREQKNGKQKEKRL